MYKQDQFQKISMNGFLQWGPYRRANVLESKLLKKQYVSENVTVAWNGCYVIVFYLIISCWKLVAQSQAKQITAL